MIQIRSIPIRTLRNSDSPHDSDTDDLDSDSELSVAESNISFDDDAYVLASETTPAVTSSEIPTTQSMEFLTAAVPPSQSTLADFLTSRFHAAVHVARHYTKL